MWAQIKSEIFENDQLDIYEKMCLIVLMSLEGDINLSSETLAKYMGCTVVTAKRALESLQKMGYFKSEEEAFQEAKREREYIHINSRESNVISQEAEDGVKEAAKVLQEETDHFREGFFVEAEEANGSQEVAFEESDFKAPESERVLKAQDEEAERRARLKAYLLGEDDQLTTEEVEVEKPFVSIKSSKQNLVDQVIEIIEEKISFKEANIILGFSGNDLDKIKRKYRVAKMSQVSDTIGVLINELQKPDQVPAMDSNVLKADSVMSTPENAGMDGKGMVENQDEDQKHNRQVNKMQILRMQAYQKQKKGPK